MAHSLNVILSKRYIEITLKEKNSIIGSNLACNKFCKSLLELYVTLLLHFSSNLFRSYGI